MKGKEPSAKHPIKDILIVEDEVIIGMALAADLEDIGYERVEIASSGEEALQIFQESPADLILLDIKLRGSMDGLETLKKIRQYAKPRTIIISGNSEGTTYKRAQAMGIDGFIVKPINLKELQHLIHTIEQAG